MTQKTFSQLVIQTVRQIPEGQVSSYGRIASICGLSRGGILVGRILHNARPLSCKKKGLRL